MLSYRAIGAITISVLAACAASGQTRDVLNRKTIRPNGLEFNSASGTFFSSRDPGSVGSISYQLNRNSGSPLADPEPWSNFQGAATGSATYTGYTLTDTSLQYHYVVTPDPVPSTRVHFALDFVPTVLNAGDGFKHLQFTNFNNFGGPAGSLMEIEVIVDGNWMLGSAESGGVVRTLTPNGLNTPWTIVEDFVYHSDIDQTRFYATRTSTGLGFIEGATFQGYLIGSEVPSMGSLTSACIAAVCVVMRRRRPSNDKLD